MSAERNSGVETIHGHLFKLDPVMLKYIDCITAKRVAEEKTKLMLELRNKGRSTEVSEDSVDLTSGEHVELEALRARVKVIEDRKRYVTTKQSILRVDTLVFCSEFLLFSSDSSSE